MFEESDGITRQRESWDALAAWTAAQLDELFPEGYAVRGAFPWAMLGVVAVYGVDTVETNPLATQVVNRFCEWCLDKKEVRVMAYATRPGVWCFLVFTERPRELAEVLRRLWTEISGTDPNDQANRLADVRAETLAAWTRDTVFGRSLPSLN